MELYSRFRFMVRLLARSKGVVPATSTTQVSPSFTTPVKMEERYRTAVIARTCVQTKRANHTSLLDAKQAFGCQLTLAVNALTYSNPQTMSFMELRFMFGNLRNVVRLVVRCHP
ncbi:Hypothetical_protein [Hexamita inflata]|uniref:Hypothetical_protein n=1 Tax=Hexamita inflata TaxID=28002 RepID=A0AA86NPF0_9EUKA|nr:Hypothetical protein HINF_LOCUS10759 [Hexamita inflata]